MPNVNSFLHVFVIREAINRRFLCEVFATEGEQHNGDPSQTL